eukprot:8615863-Pyramimonas_sp.AAC.1
MLAVQRPACQPNCCPPEVPPTRKRRSVYSARCPAFSGRQGRIPNVAKDKRRLKRGSTSKR